MNFIGFRSFKAVVAILMVSLLVGCGGGGTSSGTGGAGTGGSLSSTLVIDLGGAGFALFDPPRENSRGSLAAIASLLVADAWAQIGETTLIYINGNLTNATIIEGIAYIPLPPGAYDVCINAVRADPLDPNCQMVNLLEDQIVVISGTADPVTNEVTLDGVAVDNAADNVVLYQDPNKANKTLVCHKGNKTLSVGTSAALNGHTTHGDSLGPCAAFADGPVPNPQEALAGDGQKGKEKKKNKNKS